MFTVKIKWWKQLIGLLTQLVDAVSALRFNQIKTFGGDFVFTLPDDQPNVPFSLSPVTAADAEGNAVPVTLKLESDTPDVVAINFTDPADLTKGGELVFGKPGTASLMFTATAKSGRQELVVKASGAQFLITTGAIAPESVSGGDLAFEGITEDAPTP